MKRIEFKFAELPLVRQFFKDILTGKDGVSYDAGRAMGLFGGVAFVFFGVVQSCMGVYNLVVLKQYVEFPFVNFGLGFGSVAAGVGALIWMKKDTEPAGGTP